MRNRVRLLVGLARALTTCAALLVLATPILAQAPAGRIVGRVVDVATGLALTDVGVQVVGTTIGAMTGVDGRYALNNVPSGTVTLHVRRIGFQPKTVTGLLLDPGATVEQDLSLGAATVTLTATVVTAAAEKGSVSRALDEQRSAAAIVNSTTAEQIARSPDGNAAQAVQRVSGVTVQDGKYVFVRGLGERYTITTLNGARVPSPEPEKRVVPLDLFPASLIEAITTSKTFTPDQPGDFSGAAVNIRTREFPAERTMHVSVGMGYNSAATGRSILRAPMVGSEWLGFAGSERTIPGLIARGVGGVQPGGPTNAALRSLRNVWTPARGTGAPASSFGMTIGGEDPIFGHRVGYVASTTYTYGETVNADERWVVPRADGRGGAAPLSSYRGESGRASVLWGGLLNVSTWAGSHTRISLNSSYNRSADNEARRRVGFDEQYATELDKTRLSLIERSVLANQLRLEHAIGARHALDWSLSRSEVSRAEPDRSDIVYWLEGGRRVWKGGANDATRSFADLNERDWSAAANYRWGFGPSLLSTVKAGAYARRVARHSDMQAFDILNQRLDLPEREQTPERILIGYTAGADTNLLLSSSSFGGRYDAGEDVVAGYLMTDMTVPILPRLRVIAGARIERSAIDVRSFDAQGTPAAVDTTYTDVLPSLSMSWSLSETQNLRASATRTLARPDFRELSPVAYADIGGENEERGNPALHRTLIENYDLRWEWYPSPAEVLSVGVFAKRFDEPIERVYRATTGFPTIGYTNAAGARNYGAELDARKSLAMLGAWAAPLTLFANGTVMRSRIDVDDSLSAATNPERAMMGQAPWVINTGMTWASGARAYSATVLYNVVGRRITMAGIDPLPDTYEEARQLLDLSLQFPLPGRLTGKLNARNLLDAPYVERTGELTRRRYTTGRGLTVALGWKP